MVILHNLKCGCVVETDPESQVLRSKAKCKTHAPIQVHHDAHYFTELLSGMKDGIPQAYIQIVELEEPLAAMGVKLVKTAKLFATVLDIGCGLGYYAPLWLRLGFSYSAIEPSEFAARFARCTYDVLVDNLTFEEYKTSKRFDVICSSHAFEHMFDAPAMLAKAFSLLKPGGQIILNLPDDGDLCNPDHMWFFTPATLEALLKKIGFVDIRMTTRQRVERELFIYTYAQKPAI